MTAKCITDFFLADDVDALRGNFGTIADAIRNAETHEEVEEIKADTLRFLERIGAGER
jgi:hypothetical protein